MTLDPGRYRKTSRTLGQRLAGGVRPAPQRDGRALPAGHRRRDVPQVRPAAARAGPGRRGAGSGRGPGRADAYGLGTRTYLAGRYITHLELAWDRPVPGPILLGAGRHFGLGLMLPKAGA